MKSNKAFRLFYVVLFALGIAFQPVTAAVPLARPGEYPDSTFILPVKAGDRISVHTSLISLTIRRSADSKARLVVSAAPADWNGDLMVSMEPNSGGIAVELGLKPTDHRKSYQLSSTWSSMKVTLDIPDDHEFVLGSSFANVDIQSDFKKANITVNNGDLTASSIPQLELNAQFAKVRMNACQSGHIRVNNGEFTASDIPQLDLHAQFAKVRLNSCRQASVTSNNTTLTIGAADALKLEASFSTIDLTTVTQLTLTSNNDALSIADLGEATGEKTFGSFKIGKLRKGFSFQGQNADVSFREIASTVETLKIKDQFAKLLLPVADIPAFSLHFEGSFATVKTNLPSTRREGDQSDMNHTEFTINKGGESGKIPAFSLRCDNCEVDLE